jgi:hypothetical protein
METHDADRGLELLHGEDPDTDRADDAGHWVNVYSELLRDAEQADVVGVQTRHCEARLAFWLGRRRELLDRPEATGSQKP